MRRVDHEVTDPVKIREIITACTCCRIGLCDNGQAYIVPLNFGFVEKDGHYTLYFHSAKEGRKIDLLRKTDRVSFEMDTGYELVTGERACNYSARYQCIMGAGTVMMLEDPAEKMEGLTAIMNHAAGRKAWQFDSAVMERTCVVRLEVEELTCKVRT